MRRRDFLSLVWAVLALPACAAGATAGSRSLQAPAGARPAVVVGEYIVTAKTNAAADAIRTAYAAFGVENIQSLGRGRFLLRLSQDPGIERVRRVGLDSGNIEAVQPNYVYRNR